MRRAFIAAFLTIAVLAGCSSGSGGTTTLTPVPSGGTAPAASTPVPQPSPVARLDHRERWLVDAHGRVIILHGVNMVNKLPPFTPAAQGFDDDDAALIASLGLNVVRVGVIYSAVEPSPGQYDDEYLDQIAQTVALLNRNGVLSLLDMHQDLYAAPFTGEGFPDWAVIDDGLPAAPNEGFPYNYFVMPGLQAAWDNLWANTPGPGGIGLQDRFAAAWTHVAARFRDVPGVLGYDIFNEPFPGTDWKPCIRSEGCPEFDRQILTPFEQKVASAIRRADTRTLVFYEPCLLMGLGADTHVGPLDDPHFALSFHDYEHVPEVMQFAIDNVATTGAGLLMTEWGATTDPSVIVEVATAADAAMLPWIYWTWANRTPFFIPGGNGLPGGAANQGLVQDLQLPLVPGNVHEDRLDAVARPYPRAIAGTPTRWSFDPATRAFELRFVSTSTPGASPLANVTEIELPPRQYPRGYRATVSGGSVTSGPLDELLTVVATSPDSDVTVSVEPRK